MNPISHDALTRALTLRDLTDPSQGSHAMQLILAAITRALSLSTSVPIRIDRGRPVVPVSDNYDRLGYPEDGAARGSRYTRYVTDDLILRTQMSAALPSALRGLALAPSQDLILLFPGLVYRRDVIDRLHVGEPHQLDIWRVTQAHMRTEDLHQLVECIIGAVLPGARYRTSATSHPYTEHGLEIEVEWQDRWVEVGECGLASPRVLAEAGLHGYSGLAMGLGLDRLLMLRKGVTDIRLLREADARVSTQMRDLQPWRAVSDQPVTRRDLSVCVPCEMDAETLGDQVREGVGDEVDWIESLDWVSETPYSEMPASAIERMGMRHGQKNVLLRVTLRHPARSLVTSEGNRLRNQIYAAIHQGERHEWVTDAA